MRTRQQEERGGPAGRQRSEADVMWDLQDQSKLTPLPVLKQVGLGRQVGEKIGPPAGPQDDNDVGVLGCEGHTPHPHSTVHTCT